ncbi:aminoacyl-tRNA hydrolase [Polymorphobacter fuscus]|uniref:Peptidyl-tRNA hydrolase n=1 Tax=Sandarakinorhabdus fusca TaxID=1439888 RepID=A0A7C9KNG6_9SPHN|nr:aminoacyl-tRNA hydrolase [Polymorphobacter fuscus]KAB7644117.1 aminoacyl-tRNA hydrolase [Polymorphobacter fuscus]MQT18503.1 aminoacyl-tRNA hydrolase [Polymorphobacter fuscus]NJC08375.1 PTH1 family peptidyl-tRNA hydrolase [Polymorphobacter fuscus]
MKIFAGLGNPGAAYALNRHNIGFMAVDAIAAAHGFGPWKSRFLGLASDGRIGADKVTLLKPATFMNDSGRSVGEAVRFFKLDAAEALTVFYDELDLEPFRIKVKHGGGAAGHNGIRSIDAHLGPDYRRVRMGIGHPGHKDRVSPYVLGNFARAEMDPLADVLGAVAAEVPWLLAGDEARFMSEVARR